MRLADRWRRYWFPEGGRASAAAVRIAVALSVLWTLVRIGRHDVVAAPELASAQVYHPRSILMLLGDALPPPELIGAAQVVAWIATVALLLGLFTRTAAALSLVASLVVAGFAVSFTPTWSHDHNLPLLALIAVQGTQAGDVLGIDGWWRRRRGRPAPPATGFAWTPRLVQLTAALMFLAAVLFKLGASHFTLRWALSDNLRHQLLCQFDLNHLPRTAIGNWLLESPWRYRTAALLNLVNQAVPIFACVFVRRPLVRFALGCCFLGEVLGIGIVMNLWNPQWFPLFAAFVDWDRLLAWLRRRPAVAESDAAAPPGRHRVAMAFLTTFIAYDVVVSLAYPRIDQRLGTYPFSAFPMFATVRAKRPYDVHHSYEVVAGRFELISDKPIAPEVQVAVDRNSVNRKLHRLEDPGLLRRHLEALLADLRRVYPAQEVRGVRLWITTYQVPAYPAPAELIPHDLGILGEVGTDGRWLFGLGRLVRDGQTWTLDVPPGVDLGAASLVVYVDGLPEPRPLAATRRGDRLVVELPAGETIHIAARIDDAGGARDVLVARWRRRGSW